MLMNAHNIDESFKHIINESSDFYSKSAWESKAKVWESIQSKKNKQRNQIVKILAAACFTLLITSSYFLISHFSKKQDLNLHTQTINKLENKLNATENVIQQQQSQLALLQEQKQDTIYIDKEKIEYKTRIQTVKLTDTIYQERIVYIEKELSEDTKLLATKATENKADQPDSYVFYQANNEQIKPHKTLKFKFGGNSKKNENRSLALRSNF